MLLILRFLPPSLTVRIVMPPSFATTTLFVGCESAVRQISKAQQTLEISTRGILLHTHTMVAWCRAHRYSMSMAHQQ